MTGLTAIKGWLPHRYPMLLVDRVVDLVAGERLTAQKAVTCAEPCYQSLPDDAPESRYDYPSMLLLESWCQSAGILAVAGEPCPAGVVLMFGRMSGVRFTGRVRPGDVVDHRARQVRAMAGTTVLTGESLVAGAVVMEVGSVMITRSAVLTIDGGSAA
ncbi:MAG TPA: beta-hydroxyacyl-ACP dehydratase [Micromonosporaceae bacterium]|nr:beta-hydroxyacyl-ACP dehydratase [Micromonosporaceae bacterium]